MVAFKQIIGVLAFVTVIFTFAEVYLSFNKLWKRKHEAIVAESISVYAQFISLSTGFVITVHYLMNKEWQGFLDSTFFLIFAIFQFLVGIGLWVSFKREFGIWTLLKKSLQFEKSEVGYLAKLLFNPARCNKILKILESVAIIDKSLDEREKTFIECFAKEWNLRFSLDKAKEKLGNERHVNFLQVRKDMTDFLKTNPPVKQVLGLGDTIKVLIKLDKKISEEEKQVCDEILGFINHYIDKDTVQRRYFIAVIPQNKDEEKNIRSTFPLLKRENFKGGYGFIDGPFFTKNFASAMSKKYNRLKSLCLIVPDDEIYMSDIQERCEIS